MTGCGNEIGRMKRLRIVALSFLVPLAAFADEKSLYEIDGMNRSETHVCQPNEEVLVTGQGHVLSLTGDCRKVQVSGQGHTITVEVLGALELSGIRNTVTWGAALRGRKPTLRVTGIGNSVKQQGR